MLIKKTLLHSLLSISGITLISRIIGFMRDMLMATYFGAGLMTDAFNVAFRLPNLLRRIFAEGAFSQAFVPILAEYKTSKTHQETQNFVAHILGILILVLLCITLLGMLCATGIIWLTAPGFSHDPQKVLLTVQLLRITFPYILFISLASLIGGVLNTWGIFSIPAFTPTILNLSFIVFIIYFRQMFHPPIFALAVATFFGGLLQFLFQIPFLKKIDMLVFPKFKWHDPAVWRVVSLMAPAIFAVSISQISLIINTIYASFLPNGSISWLYYADRLMEFPTGVLGVALGTILLPSLSKHATNKDTKMFSQTLDWGLRLCLLLAVPATVGLALIAKPLTMTLFMHGKFTLVDVMMTEKALMAYAVGLIGLILVKIFAPGFYANQDIKTPVKVAVFVLICTQIMNLAFIGPLQHAGLALSIGLGACINAGCLGTLLIKRKMYIPEKGFGPFILRIASAIFIMLIITQLSLTYLPLNFMGPTLIRVVSLFALLVLAMSSYFISLYLVGIRVKSFNRIYH